MAIEAYMKMTAKTQGDIVGDVSASGYVGWIELFELRWGAEAPVDLSTGAGAGKVKTDELQVSTPTGRHTPHVFQALDTNELLTAVEIDVIQGGQTSSTKYTIDLVNALVVSFSTNWEGNGASFFDSYSLTFEQVTLTWKLPSGQTSQSVAAPSGWQVTTTT